VIGSEAMANVLVVLPCLNEARTLPGILGELLSNEAAPGLLVVVADGGSTDGTIDVVRAGATRDPRVRLLENPMRLQSAGVNLAVERFGANRDWLVRMDAHAAYPAKFVRRLVEAAQRTGSDSVVVPMITRGRTCFEQAAAAAQNSLLGTGGAAHRRISGGGWVDHGHHALFLLSRFRALGGYNEHFLANEDAEFDVRLARSGGRIWLEDELAIGYHPRAALPALFRQYLRHGAGRAQTLLLHKMRPKFRQGLPLLVAPAVLLLAPALFRPALGLPFAAWAAACLAYGALLGARQRGLCASLAGMPAMTMHLGWSLGFWMQLLASLGRRRAQ
jgi:succinoglycan biosynthesis protein ExoA